MEYFIVQEGTMWNTILTILEEKVKEGVEVRFMYDDLGCIGTLPNQYYKILRQKGIQCIPFHPFVPIATILHNNRDHRKITVVDGYMGFTGGVNLADEYINVYEKHGHWKDSGVYLEGEAVRTLTMLFLESWDKHSGTNTKYKYYLPHTYHSASFSGTGYVIPYGDTPLDQELVGETVYLNLIHQATSYIYINTPYFIVDYEFVLALSIAAKKGVDVRICTPHIPDKWYVHMVTQSYYEALLEAGVKIYEYNPGFLHAKSIVVDDLYGVVGTINMDFRSFCHHYECAVWFYQSDCIESLKKDYLETLKVCVRIDLADCQKMSWYKRWLQSVLRFFGPLM